MCPHDSFEVLYYDLTVMVRRCNQCGKVEIRTERWCDLFSLQVALNIGKAGVRDDANITDGKEA